MGAGAALPLAFAPFDLYPLAVLTPALLLLLLTDSPRSALHRGYLFGLGLFAVGVTWVYVAIHEFGNTGVILAAIFTALFVAFLALFPALAAFLTVRLQLFVPGGVVATRLLLFPALWVVAEWVRGWILTGFPWLSLGFSQTDSPLRGWLPIGGVYLVSLMCATSAGALALAGRERCTNIIVGSVLLVLWLGGAGLSRVVWTEPLAAPLRVALVQGNVPQETKWNPDAMRFRLDRYREMSYRALAEAELVVWPENAVTMFYQTLAVDYFAPLRATAIGRQATLVVGVPVRDEHDAGYYTSLVKLGTDVQFYHKRHLVPFGEYLPLASVLRGLIGFFDIPMSAFSAGEPEQLLFEIGSLKAAQTICFEDAFPADLTAQLEEANLILNASNNGWYGDSLAPHQHLQIARALALSAAKPILRATTNGISAVIDADGDVVVRSKQFRRQLLTGTLQPRSGATPFARIGGWWVVLFCAGVLLVPLSRMAKRVPFWPFRGDSGDGGT